MTRGTMLTLLERRLNDQENENWSTDLLNTYLNLAYALILKEIRKVDPEAILNWEYITTIANINWYEKPAGTRGIAEVGLKSLSADTDWTALKRKPYYVARDWTGTDNVYCHRANYIGIFPAPTTAVTNGIQLIHTPTATLAADTDVPRVEETLQLGIVYWAALLAKGESPESDSKEAQHLQSILSDIPSDYGGYDLSQPMQLDADVADARGRRVGILSPGSDPGRFL